MLAVVRDEDVVADEGSKSGPDFGKTGRIPDLAIRVAVDLARPRRDRPVRLDHGVKPVHDLALHHPRGADLDDAARRDVGVRGLEVERHVTLEWGIVIPRVYEL